MLQNNLLLETLEQKETKSVPIWFMRQAGRYLPEYMTLRAKAGSFLNLCQNPELASKVTLQPVDRFNLDAAILFSDILVLPQAMGMELQFIEHEGPKFGFPIKNKRDIDNLSIDINTKLEYVAQTIKQTKLSSTVPLIGFSGCPFTLACYMVEGGTSHNGYFKMKQFMYEHTDLAHQLLEKLTDACIRYIGMQIDAGVDAIMLFDTWSNILSYMDREDFALRYIYKITNGIASIYKVPVVLFAKNDINWISNVNGLSGLGVDWTVSLAGARQSLLHKNLNLTLQGNLDPTILRIGNRQYIAKTVKRILDDYYLANNSSFSNLIFNLGHGVTLGTNPDDVAFLVDTVRAIVNN